jgi:Homeodomain-like domain
MRDSPSYVEAPGGRPQGRLIAIVRHRRGRGHLHRLLRRYREGGLDDLEPRSRRPRTSPHRTSDAVRGRITALRTTNHWTRSQWVSAKGSGRGVRLFPIFTKSIASRLPNGLLSNRTFEWPRLSLVTAVGAVPTIASAGAVIGLAATTILIRRGSDPEWTLDAAVRLAAAGLSSPGA